MTTQKLGAELRKILMDYILRNRNLSTSSVWPAFHNASATIDHTNAEMQDFLTGFLGAEGKTSNLNNEGDNSTYAGNYELRDIPSNVTPIIPESPNPLDIVFMANSRARLKPGQLLIAIQKDNSIVTYDLKTGKSELVCRFLNTPMLLWRAVPCRDGTFFCSMSGTRWPGQPGELAFGQGGALFHVDHRKEELTIVGGSEDLKDPGELRLIDDDTLLIGDFQGFGGTGSIYKLDLKKQEKTCIATGGILREPVAFDYNHGDQGLYIANAMMSYSHRVGPGGKLVKEIGAIIRLPETLNLINGPPDENGAMRRVLEVLHDNTHVPEGVFDSIAFEDVEHRFAIVTRNDWPAQETGALLRFDKTSSTLIPLISASGELAMFSRAEAGPNGIGYAADSYNKLIHTVDIMKGKIIETKSLEQLLGPTIGMVNPVDTVESLRYIS